ncbi:MAG TPA: MBL fold metallo-hydrolase, partial [Candidatus Limnocylindrales bacterium]|nr:MBL fold metallo-hydrolase [Candidatus Limnocylindrales bacterium]
MERLHRVVGPLATNVHVLADERSREAIAIDTATPCLAWIAEELAARGWTLKLIVSSHGHWDHIGDNAAVAEHTGAEVAAHPLDHDRLIRPRSENAPFEIPPSVPAVDLAEGGEVRFG